MKPIRKILNRFLTETSGSITIESILWLPFYALFIIMIINVSLMFNGRAQVQRTLQDINRLASSGYYVSEEEVEARIRSLLSHISSNLEIEATIDSDLGVITAVASLPVNDLTVIGSIPEFANFDVTVGAWHLIES